MSTTTTPRTATPDLLGSDELRIDGREKGLRPGDVYRGLTRRDMLWAAFVASPYAHAEIVRIDAAAARAMRGRARGAHRRGHRRAVLGTTLSDWPILAFEKVRFIGEFVAAVAADTRETR